jgi:hypothetical protein
VGRADACGLPDDVYSTPGPVEHANCRAV